MPIPITSPYLTRGFTWLRGTLHAHSTFSDGSLPPEEVIALYEQHGYDFLALSDHDKRVSPAEYQAQTRMVLLPADEVTAHGPHMLAISIHEAIPPDRDRQKVIDAVRAQGGFVVLNHPNWQREFNHHPQESMERLTGYAGIEIYNGVVEYETGSALALDRWDRLLGSGRRVWGFANDDFHRPEAIERGWNVVQATDRTAAAIVEALEQGRFYASTGVEITRVGVEEGRIVIVAPNAQRIRFIAAYGRELAYVDASEAEYTITGSEELYVRAECYGEGVRAAWTQPFFLGVSSF